MADPSRQTLKARWVFPVTGPPLEDGCVAIDGERIVAVGRDLPGLKQDLGNVAILPGLVNAHTHLELSDVAAPLGQPGIGLVEWIGFAIAHRQRRTTSTDPVASGLDESRRLGTTTLGEIAQAGFSSGRLDDGQVDTTAFVELIAPTSHRIDAALRLAKGLLTSRLPEGSPEHHAATFGLSPHAPYSVHPDLLHAVVSLSQTHRTPVAFHLAESREEMELLRTGSGPFRQFLEKIGAWDSAAFIPGCRPLDYLRWLAPAYRTLVVHGNYLDEEEIDFLAAHRDRMAVVYCPRTHAYFGHEPHPLARLLAAGAVVALGTDSRASSPDLSVLAEMRFMAARYPRIAAREVLRLGTIAGAIALGQERLAGSVEPRKLANLAIVALPDRDARDPHELLLASETPVIGRYWHGQVLCCSGERGTSAPC